MEPISPGRGVPINSSGIPNCSRGPCRFRRHPVQRCRAAVCAVVAGFSANRKAASMHGLRQPRTSGTHRATTGFGKNATRILSAWRHGDSTVRSHRATEPSIWTGGRIPALCSPHVRRIFNGRVPRQLADASRRRTSNADGSRRTAFLRVTPRQSGTLHPPWRQRHGAGGH